MLCPLRQGAVPVESCAGRDRHGRPQQAPPLTARGHLVLPAACCGRGIVSGTNRAARRLAVVSPGVAGLAVPVSQNGQQSGNEQHSNSSRCRPSPQHLPQLNRSKQLPQTASGPGSDPQLPYRADNAQNRPIGAPIAATRPTPVTARNRRSAPRVRRRVQGPVTLGHDYCPALWVNQADRRGRHRPGP